MGSLLMLLFLWLPWQFYRAIIQSIMVHRIWNLQLINNSRSRSVLIGWNPHLIEVSSSVSTGHVQHCRSVKCRNQQCSRWDEFFLMHTAPHLVAWHGSWGRTWIVSEQLQIYISDVRSSVCWTGWFCVIPRVKEFPDAHWIQSEGFENRTSAKLSNVTGFGETGHRSIYSSAAREESGPGTIITFDLNGFLPFFKRIA